LPVYLDPEASPILKYLPFEADMNQYRLKVTGLKAGDWKLVVQGIVVGTNTAEQLAQGVNLAMMPGPWQALGAKVNAFCADQENIYFTLWRQVQLVGVPSEAQPEQQALLKKLNDILATRESLRLKAPATDRTWTWSLTCVAPPPKPAQ